MDSSKNDLITRAAFEAAFAEARLAFAEDEVPVGAVIVCNGEIVTRQRNRIVQWHEPTAHAELLAIRSAARELGNERLVNCALYTTLEPCTMCSGAAILARLAEIHFLAEELRLPAWQQICSLPGFNHYPVWQKHDYAHLPASELLREFFQRKRSQPK